MELDKRNDEKEILYVIDKEGRITSVPEVKDELIHYETYSRLNEKLREIYERRTEKNIVQKIPFITEDDTVQQLPNKYAKKGFINIFPIKVNDLSYGFGVIFPNEKTDMQLEALKSLYSILEQYEILFFKQPCYEDGDYLDWNMRKKGIAELKKYVEEEIKKIRGIRDKKSEDSRL